MSKVCIGDRDMATFLVCEAIGEERKDFQDLQPDENGMYDLVITVNGKELNVDRFLDSLNRSYQEAVITKADNLLSNEYDKLISSIHEIQETLEEHSRFFGEGDFNE